MRASTKPPLDAELKELRHLPGTTLIAAMTDVVPKIRTRW